MPSPQARAFLQLAQRAFRPSHGAFDAPRRTDHYMDLTARLSRGLLPRGRLDAAFVDLPSPIRYLSDIQTSAFVDSFRQPQRPTPGFSIVVGAYGVGKTELLLHVVQRMDGHQLETGSDVGCLPIRLGSSHSELPELLAAPEAHDILRLLVKHIQAGVDDALAAELVECIRSGQLTLVLDALDEMAGDRKSYRRLLEQIRVLAGSEHRASRSNVIVSVRLEYLKQVDGEKDDDGRAMAALLGQHGTPVSFLLLDFFEESALYDYMLWRLQDDGAAAVSRVRERRKLREVLRRPLLARIFCDLIETPADAQGGPSASETSVVGRAMQAETATELIRLFVTQTTLDSQLREDQENLRPAGLRGDERYFWHADRLAEESLRAYRRGQMHLDQEHIERIVGLPPAQDPLSLARMLHKCPFVTIVLTPAIEAGSEATKMARLTGRFLHRIFIEYFITQGIVDELAVLSPPDPDAQRRHGFASFHDLVLNIDMHRFLRELTISKAESYSNAAGKQASRPRDWWWYEQTAVAYGLTAESEAEWSPPLTEMECLCLNEIRRKLLDVRSGIISTDQGILLDNLIESYLKLEDGAPSEWVPRPRPLTPRYCVPNYEAIAVCLLDPKLYAKYSGTFSDLLKRRLGDARLRLCGDLPDGAREPHELLCERIFDIGRRFRFSWVMDWSPADVVPYVSSDATSRPPLVIRSNDGCLERIRAILDEVGGTRTPAQQS